MPIGGSAHHGDATSGGQGFRSRRAAMKNDAILKGKKQTDLSDEDRKQSLKNVSRIELLQEKEVM